MVFETYAKYYDLLYRDKDYEAECAFIREAFSRYAQSSIVSVLDVGCGTGGHAIPLARAGYQVSGVDLSSEMLGQARRKSEDAGLQISFQAQDMRRLSLQRRYDAAICMFASLGYVTATKEVIQALTSIRSHVRQGGLFVCDFWNGIAVLRILPSERLKIVEAAPWRLIRFVRPELVARRHICRNNYQLLALKQGRLVDEVAESHEMRFFFPEEIVHFLEEADFQTLEICSFPDRNDGVDESAWNIAVIARAGGAG